jgi:hypothetical protein
MKKTLGILVCLMMIGTLIPITTAINCDTEAAPADLVGLTWVRGFIINPKVVLGRVNCRALRLHYVEFTGMETDLGIVRLRDVSFRDGIGIKYVNIGPLGTLTWVMGLTYGSININN